MASTTANMPDPDMTFGIELEFLAIHKFQEEDEELDPAYVAKMIQWWMVKADIAVFRDGDPEDDDSHPRYTRWHVHHDVHRLGKEEWRRTPDGWIEEPLELASRKFRLCDSAWVTEVREVLKLLRSIEGPMCRLLTNVLTGFHVHVGYDTAFVPLRTAKNVFQFFTAFERQFDQINFLADRMEWAKTATDLPLSAFHKYQKPVEAGFGNPYRVSQKRNNYLLDQLYDIETLDSYWALSSVFHIDHDGEKFHDHCSNVNFDNLYFDWRNNGGKPSGTIEFRGHSGTLDWETVNSWVQLTTFIVDYCDKVPPVDFLSLLYRGLDRTFTLRQVLESMRCPVNLTAAYCPLVHMLPRNTSEPPELRDLLEYNAHVYAHRSNPDTTGNWIRTKDALGEYGVPCEEDCPPLAQPGFSFLLLDFAGRDPEFQCTGGFIAANMDVAREAVLGRLADEYAREVQARRRHRVLRALKLQNSVKLILKKRDRESGK